MGFLSEAGYGFIRPGVAGERDMSSRIRLRLCALVSKPNVRFWRKADTPSCKCPLSGAKRTWVGALQMSAFDPKRT
jgi:hypothetical protein